MPSDVFVFRPLAHFLHQYVLPNLTARLSSGAIREDALPVEVRTFRAFGRPSEGGKVSNVVELNEEVQLRIRTKSTRPIEAGEEVTSADIQPEECYIEPPMHNGKPLAYFLYVRLFLNHLVFFDFSSNSPDVSEDVGTLYRVKYPVTEIINAIHLIRTTDPDGQFKHGVLSNAA